MTTLYNVEVQGPTPRVLAALDALGDDHYLPLADSGYLVAGEDDRDLLLALRTGWVEDGELAVIATEAKPADAANLRVKEALTITRFLEYAYRDEWLVFQYDQDAQSWSFAGEAEGNFFETDDRPATTYLAAVMDALEHVLEIQEFDRQEDDRVKLEREAQAAQQAWRYQQEIYRQEADRLDLEREEQATLQAWRHEQEYA